MNPWIRVASLAVIGGALLVAALEAFVWLLVIVVCLVALYVLMSPDEFSEEIEDIDYEDEEVWLDA